MNDHPKQLLHLVIGGELENFEDVTFKDLDAVDIAERIDVIRPVEQALVGDPDLEFRFHSGPPA